MITRPAGTDGPEENDVDVARNADVFAEIVQCLDNRSLTLVMRDVKDDGRKAIEILREHYVGKGKPRVIALYTELTSLKMSEDCGLTDYVLKAETATTSLKSAGEEINDSLLVAMVLKGLPTQYNTCCSKLLLHRGSVRCHLLNSKWHYAVSRRRRSANNHQHRARLTG